MGSEKIEEYTRVTDILRPFSKLDDVPEHVLDQAGVRGQFVHDVIHARALGLGDPPIPKKWEGYIKSYELWQTRGDKIEWHEKRFFDEDMKITGQVDAYGDGIIFDFKTSSQPGRTWGSQLAAYVYLCEGNGLKTRKAKIIHLQKDGKFPTIIEFDEREIRYNWKMFICAYECYMTWIK